MALIDKAAYFPVLVQMIPDGVVKMALRTSTLLSMLPIQSNQNNGLTLNWDIELDGAQTEFFAENVNPTNFTFDGAAKCSLNIVGRRGNFGVTHHALIDSLKRSPRDFQDLPALQFGNHLRKLAHDINGLLYTGVSPNIVGLGEIIDSTGAYANQTHALWTSYVADNGGTPQAVTLDQLYEDTDTIKATCGEKPTYAMVSTKTFSKIRGLFTNQQQVVVPLERTIRGPLVAESNIESININGCKFVLDTQCPDGEIYYINENYLAVVMTPPADMDGSVFEDHNMVDVSMLTASDINFLSSIGCYQLQKGGPSNQWTMELFSQLKCTKRNAFGKRLDVLV